MSALETQLMQEINSHLDLLSGNSYAEDTVPQILRECAEKLSDLIDEVHSLDPDEED